MNPHVSVTHGQGAWDHNRALCWGVLLNIFLIVLQGTIVALRGESSRERNTSDLSAEVCALLLEEEWVSDDFVLEISSEVDLDLSCSLDISRKKIRKLSPGLKRGVSCPVNIFVNTRASSLEARWLLILSNPSI
jgi:hypothetical protein